jgi:hypothetical protein
MLRNSKLLASAMAAAAACFASWASAAELKAAAYTDLRYGLDYFNDAHSTNPADVNFDNHGSYWGVKGSAEQGGVTAFGAYERWLDADTIAGIDLARQAYAGVKGVWGVAQYGTFATAYMETGRKLDPFFATGAAGVGQPSFTIAGGQSHGLSNLTADRVTTLFGGGGGGFAPNQLAYTTPGLFGVTANVAVFFDDSAGANTRDDFAAGVEFSEWGITAGLQYLDANNDTTTIGPPAAPPAGNTGLPEDQEAYRLYAGYAQKLFGVGVSAERIDRNLNSGPTPADDDQDYLMVSGWFGVLEGTRIAASYGLENETVSEGDSLRFGIFHDMLDNFTTHVAYRRFNGTTAGALDDQVVTLGASFKFELSGSTTR